MCVYACVCTCVHTFIKSFCCVYFWWFCRVFIIKTIAVLFQTKLSMPTLCCRLNLLKRITCQEFHLNSWHVIRGTDRLYAPFPL